MTQEEKTTLRIEAARATGYKDGPPDKYGWYDPQGVWVCYLRFNPLEDDADLNALLVATMARGWCLDSGLFSPQLTEFGITLRSLTGELGEEFPVQGCSRNEDSLLAYREAVTLACVAACHAEEEAQKGHSQPRSDEEGGE